MLRLAPYGLYVYEDEKLYLGVYIDFADNTAFNQSGQRQSCKVYIHDKLRDNNPERSDSA